MVWRKGDPIEFMLLVREGEIRVLAGDEDRNEASPTRISASGFGQAFGSRVLLRRGSVYGTSALALSCTGGLGSVGSAGSVGSSGSRPWTGSAIKGAEKHPFEKPQSANSSRTYTTSSSNTSTPSGLHIFATPPGLTPNLNPNPHPNVTLPLTQARHQPGCGKPLRRRLDYATAARRARTASCRPHPPQKGAGVGVGRSRVAVASRARCCPISMTIST